MKTLSLCFAAAAMLVLSLGGEPATAQSKGKAKAKGQSKQLPPVEVVTYAPAEKVAEALSKSGMLAPGRDYSVIGSHRGEGPGIPEMHENFTDIYYVTEGSGTFVTGGTYEGYEETQPGEPRGGTISGGVARVLKPGDVIVIPPGIPHWFKEIPEQINYLLIKVQRD